VQLQPELITQLETPEARADGRGVNLTEVPTWRARTRDMRTRERRRGALAASCLTFPSMTASGVWCADHILFDLPLCDLALYERSL
jgi:hypothetical protein